MKNLFGGENPNSLYTPMSEDEREVLSRLIEDDDLEVTVKEWGTVNKFMDENGQVCKPRLGDKNLEMKFWVKFSKPDTVYIPIHYFDLELRTKGGLFLFAERQAIRDFDGGPLQAGCGRKVPMAWTIAIHEMDPKLVRAIKPGSRGLTTREGNRHLSEGEQEVLHHVRTGEAKVRELNRQEAVRATKESVY